MTRSAQDSHLLKVGELSRRTGKTVRALRLYESEGLLQPKCRSKGGFRLYGTDAVVRVYWIAKLQDLGFSLAQIRNLLSTVERSRRAPEAMEAVRELFRGKLEATRAQIARLSALERDLEESLAYLEGCRSCEEESAPQACATCSTPHVGGHGRPPALVAGLVRRAPAQEEISKP
ncbi:MAG: MerR family transcriptional regulator [Deltaproteobacteria bacterium]|nr:MAG: MerR family transcriptional regulator [Deltaproteobacteria bacterium]